MKVSSFLVVLVNLSMGANGRTMRCAETQQSRIILRAKPTHWFTNTMPRLVQRWYRAHSHSARLRIAFHIRCGGCGIGYEAWKRWSARQKLSTHFQHFFFLLLLSVSFLRKSRLAHSFGVSGPLLPTRHIYSFLLIYLIEVICLILCENLFLFPSLSLPRSPVTVTVTISMNFSQRRFKSDNFCPNSIWFMFET